MAVGPGSDAAAARVTSLLGVSFPVFGDPRLEVYSLFDYRRVLAVVRQSGTVVIDRDGYAMYFSRAPIPFTRDGSPDATAWRHIGLYVYRRTTLLRLTSLTPTEMERAEALEQLRAIEHGIRIKTVETRHNSLGVDTPDDLERVRQVMAMPAPFRG